MGILLRQLVLMSNCSRMTRRACARVHPACVIIRGGTPLRPRVFNHIQARRGAHVWVALLYGNNAPGSRQHTMPFGYQGIVTRLRSGDQCAIAAMRVGAP